MSWWKQLFGIGKKEQAVAVVEQKQQHICDSCTHYMVCFEEPDYLCALRICKPIVSCKKYKGEANANRNC